MIYKCDSCGSSMVYDPKKRKLICPYCGKKRADMPIGEETDGKACPTCGAPLHGTERALVTECPYCGTWLSIDPNLRDADAPGKILPFAIRRDQARQRVIDAFDNVPFLTKIFLSDPDGKDIQAVYAPFWLYSAQVNGHSTYSAEKVLPHGGKTEHQKYFLSRDTFSQFSHIPVDAMESLEDGTIDAAVGGDVKDLQDFDPAYLAGTSATLPEKPKQDPTYQQRAEDWAYMSVDAKEKEGLTDGYTSAKRTDCDRQFILDTEQAQSVLLPVYRYEYKGFGLHKIYIDGHTGSMSGDAPCDRGRVLLHYMIELICAGISLAAIVGIVGVLL